MTVRNVIRSVAPFFFILTLVYINIAKAGNGECYISKLSLKGFGEAIYKHRKENSAMSYYIDTGKDPEGNNSFRVNFRIEKRFSEKAPEYLELYTVDSNGEHFRVSRGLNDIEGGKGVCSTLKSTKKRHYPCYIEYSFDSEETDFSYDKFIIIAYDDTSNEMMRLVGKKPVLEIELEKTENDWQEDKLLLRNSQTKTIKIKDISVNANSHFYIPNRINGKMISSYNDLEFKIKVRPGNYRGITDILTINYQIGGLSLIAEVSLGFDDYEAVKTKLDVYRNDRDRYEEKWHESMVEKNKLWKEKEEAEDRLSTCQWSLEESNELMSELHLRDHPNIFYFVNGVEIENFNKQYNSRKIEILARNLIYYRNEIQMESRWLLEKGHPFFYGEGLEKDIEVDVYPSSSVKENTISMVKKKMTHMLDEEKKTYEAIHQEVINTKVNESGWVKAKIIVATVIVTAATTFFILAKSNCGFVFWGQTDQQNTNYGRLDNDWSWK